MRRPSTSGTRPHEDLCQEIADTYHNDNIEFERLTALVGHEVVAHVSAPRDQLSDEFINATAV